MRFIETTGAALQIEEGSLYPALYRLEDRGWIESEMGLSENNRRARFYRLTPAGRAQLKTEVADFRRFVTAVFQVIEGPASS
jgi:DNA-binding PadR family transcriptional regulator